MRPSFRVLATGAEDIALLLFSILLFPVGILIAGAPIVFLVWLLSLVVGQW